MRRNTADTRPKIWSEGRQHPPLDARAFALATVSFARKGLSALLGRCAGSARSLGSEVVGGAWRIPEDRLGRTGRFLPSHRRVGRAVTDGAVLLEETARILRAATAPAAKTESIFAVAPLAPRPVQRLPRSVVAVAPALHDEAPIDADLAAIRALIGPGLPPAAHAPEAVEPAAPPPRRRSVLRAALAGTLGYGLLVIAVPYGAVRAGIAHLNGEDLRQLVD